MAKGELLAHGEGRRDGGPPDETATADSLDANGPGVVGAWEGRSADAAAGPGARGRARTAADGDWVVERRGGSDGGEERLGAAAWLGGAEAQAEAARPSAVGGTEPLAGMALTAPDDVAVATAAHCDGRHATA